MMQIAKTSWFCIEKERQFLLTLFTITTWFCNQ